MSLSKTITLACALLVSLVGMLIAGANFARLESRTDAPGVSELAGYVCVPGLIAVVSMIVVAFVVIPLVKRGDASWHSPPPPPAPPAVAPVPVVPPSTGPTADVFLLHSAADPEAVATKRAHVWQLLDELSEEMRDDNEGSEALFTLRERFHRLQFAPEHEPEPEPAPPVKKSNQAA